MEQKDAFDSMVDKALKNFREFNNPFQTLRAGYNRLLKEVDSHRVEWITEPTRDANVVLRELTEIASLCKAIAQDMRIV